MRAVVFEAFGEPAEVLSARDVPEPTAGHGEVLVRMLASPVNPSDLMTVRGVYGQRPNLPATPGYEGVGVVETGDGLIGKFLVGKRVAVLNRVGGNWAEKAVVPARQCVPLPDDLPTEQAAMFFVNPATAYVMTRKVLAIPKGETLLQTAAGSSLGKMVVRLGKRYGFKTLCVVRRTEQGEELKSLGADAVAVFDGDRDDPQSLAEQVLRITDGRGVRYAIDPVGGPTGTGVVRSMRDGGRLLVFGTLSGQPTAFDGRDLLTHGLRIEGFWLSRWFGSASLPRRLSLVRKVSGLMRSGVLTNDVGEPFPLDAVADAVAASERPARGGKAWLRIAEA